MLSSLFNRRPDVQDPTLFWTPPGHHGRPALPQHPRTAGGRDRPRLHLRERPQLLLRRRVPGLHLPRGPQRPPRPADGDGGRRPRQRARRPLPRDQPGVPAIPDDADAAQLVRSRLQSNRPHGVSPHPVHLTDFLEDRVDLQRDDDFVKQAMFEIVRTEGHFLKAAPAYSGSTGTRFLVQPHPPRK